MGVECGWMLCRCTPTERSERLSTRGWMRLIEQAVPIEPSSDHPGLNPSLRPRRGRTFGCGSPSVPTPIRRPIRPHGVGTPISGHDVSGTGWQTLGRAMQPTTTMTPVWQCGHSRNDCPVNASKRSRWSAGGSAAGSLVAIPSSFRHSASLRARWQLPRKPK